MTKSQCISILEQLRDRYAERDDFEKAIDCRELLGSIDNYTQEEIEEKIEKLIPDFLYDRIFA